MYTRCQWANEALATITGRSAPRRRRDGTEASHDRCMTGDVYVLTKGSGSSAMSLVFVKTIPLPSCTPCLISRTLTTFAYSQSRCCLPCVVVDALFCSERADPAPAPWFSNSSETRTHARNCVSPCLNSFHRSDTDKGACRSMYLLHTACFQALLHLQPTTTCSMTWWTAAVRVEVFRL